MLDLRSPFSVARNKPKEDTASRRKKMRMNFIDFYRHQYGYDTKVFEDLYSLSKLTTPKENVKRKKAIKRDRESLTQFDLPISLLVPNPLGIHYFELFSLSIAMYTKLKEEFRTQEFIEKYLYDLYVIKPDRKEKQSWDDAYSSNHFLFDSAYVQNLYEKKKPPSSFEESKEGEKEVRIEVKQRESLDNIFMQGLNSKMILECLTCSSASRGYNYEIYEFLGDAVIALLTRFESVLFNQSAKENDLDIERLNKESNLKFCDINKKYGFYNYMIGSSDTTTKTFVPPLFDQSEFQNITNLKKNEMINKLLFFRAMRAGSEKSVANICDLLYKTGEQPQQKLDEKAIEERTFQLKNGRR